MADIVQSSGGGGRKVLQNADSSTTPYEIAAFLTAGGLLQPVSAANPLPTTGSGGGGGGNVNLNQVGGVAFALGQALKAASLPVTLASDQGAVTVSGTVTANAGSGTMAENLTQVGGSAFALGQALKAASLPVTLASDQGAVTVSGTVTANAGTGTMSENLAQVGGSAVVSAATGVQQVGLADGAGTAVMVGQKVMASSLPVAIASNQSAVPVSGTVTANAGTGNFGTNTVQVAGSAVVAAAAGVQQVGIADSAGASITVGQKAMAASVPVTMASNQTPISLAATTGSLAAVSNTVTVAGLAGFTVVTVSVHGTYSGLTMQFEASDDGGTTFYPVVAQQSTSFAASGTGSISPGSNASASWQAYIGGFTQFRARATAISTGSATVNITPNIGAMAPAPTVALTDAGGLLIGSASTVDAVSASNRVLIVSSQQYQFNGATWDRIRNPNIFKTATATASGDTAVWTPTSGKKFRLQRYSIQITADAATTGGADIDILLRDSTTGLAASFTTFVPAAAGTTFGNTNQTGWIDLGNGILSAAANNVLNVNLSAALTSGKVRVVACGTEE